MKLYFGNTITAVTTLLIITMGIFIGASISNRNQITLWGRHILIIIFLGWLICCFAATRDGFNLSVQNVIDRSTLPGVFNLVSFQSIAGSVIAIIMIGAAIFAGFSHNQKTREVIFYIILSGITCKVLIMEISRIALYIGGKL